MHTWARQFSSSPENFIWTNASCLYFYPYLAKCRKGSDNIQNWPTHLFSNPHHQETSSAPQSMVHHSWSNVKIPTLALVANQLRVSIHFADVIRKLSINFLLPGSYIGNEILYVEDCPNCTPTTTDLHTFSLIIGC